MTALGGLFPPSAKVSGVVNFRLPMKGLFVLLIGWILGNWSIAIAQNAKPKKSSPNPIQSTQAGWGDQLPEIGNIGIYSTDSLKGVFTSFSPGFGKHLLGSFYPQDSLLLTNSNDPLGLISRFVGLDSALQGQLISFPSNLSLIPPGYYEKSGDLIISDTIELQGNSSDLFYFRASGKIIFQTGAFVKFSGISPLQVLFFAEQEIIFQGLQPTHLGILFSKSAIMIQSNAVMLTGVFTDGPITFDPIQGDIVPEVMGWRGPINRPAVACPITLAENGFNLVQNPGFEKVGSGVGNGIGGGRLQDLCVWFQEGHITVDVFHDDADNYTDLCPSSNNPSTYRIEQSSHSQSPTTPALPNSNGQNNRYIGMFHSTPSSYNLEKCSTHLLEPLDPAFYYLFAINTSPATGMGNTSSEIRIFLTSPTGTGTLPTVNIGWNNITLTNGIWNEYARFLKPTRNYRDLEIGDGISTNLSSIPNPNFSNCSTLIGRAYNFYDNLLFFKIPNPVPSVSFNCTSEPLTLVNITQENLQALISAGISFEWRVNGMVISTQINLTVQPVISTTYQLYAIYNGVSQFIGATTYSVNGLNPYGITVNGTACQGETLSASISGTSYPPPTNIRWMKEVNGNFELVQQGGYLFSILNAQPQHSGNYICLITKQNCVFELPFAFTVHPKPVITAEPINVCRGSFPCGIPLMATPVGGTWTGTGISQNIEGCDPGWVFNATDPDDENDHGLPSGSYPLHYSFTDGNGCTNQVTLTAIIRPENILDFSVENPTCPGRPIYFYPASAQIPGATYYWTIVYGQDNLYFPGYNGFTHTFSDPGNAIVTFHVINPSDPDFCPGSFTRRLTIENPTVPIFSKNYTSPIVVCSDVHSLILETVEVEGGIYTWEKVSGIFLQPVSPDQPHRVSLPLNPVIIPPSSTTVLNLTIAPYMGCSEATGTITITRKVNQFSGIPGFSYTDPFDGAPVTGNPALPIHMCSGHELTLIPSNNLTYSGSLPVVYQWTGSGLSNPIIGNLTVSNLNPGTYIYVLKAMEQGESGCGSEITKVTVIVDDNNHQMTIGPIPVAGYPNDFDARVTFDTQGALEWDLYFNNTQLLQTGTVSQNYYNFNIYNPDLSTCRPDGKYSFQIYYSDGCYVRRSFTLLGEKGITTPIQEYQNSLHLSGLVFIHHNVKFTGSAQVPTPQKTLHFSNAHVYVRGGAGPDEPILGGFGPGPVTGASISVSGSKTNFVVSNSIFESALDRMWNGISVGAIQSFQFGNFNGNVLNDSKVKDAKIGIQLSGSPAGLSFVTNTRFENCYYGLVSKAGKEPIEPFDNTIKQCYFGCDPQQMKKPYQQREVNGDFRYFYTQAGAWLTGGSRYPKITYQGNPYYTFTLNQFENCYTGVLIGLENPNRRVEVDQCTFDNNRFAGIATTAGLRLVNNCDFLIPDQGTGSANAAFAGVVTNSSYGIHGYNNGFEAKNCRFGPTNGVAKVPGFHTGILAKNDDDIARIFTLTANTFTNLRTAIDLQKEGAAHGDAQFDLELRCNEFVYNPQTENNAISGIGLRLGEEARLAGPIGNSGLNNSPNPSGNVWPIDPASLMANPVSNGPGVIANWMSPEGWRSLKNENPDPTAVLEYWAFDNEYVRDPIFETPTNRVRRRVPPALQIIVYPEGTTPPSNPDYEYVEQCSADLPNVFPLPLRPTKPNENETTQKLASIGHPTGNLVLGDAIPNPTSGNTKIPVFIPLNHTGTVLFQIFDLTGRAIRWQTELTRTGSQWVEVSLQTLPAGVYGYCLVDNGKNVGNRKLVLIR